MGIDIGKPFRKIRDNPKGAIIGALTFGATMGGSFAIPGAAAGASMEEDLTAEPEPLPTLIDENALNEEAKRVLKEERDRQKTQPGIRNQTVLTSSRRGRPSLLSE